jgi:glycosyltransferase 2 family protein
MSNLQKAFNWLRWPLALGIVALLCDQHRDGVERLAQQPLAWAWLLFAVCLRSVVTVLGCVRWRALVRAQEIPFAMRDALRLGCFSNLLNYVVPGTIGGDVTKVVLVARENPTSRAIVAATVVLDRVLGLLSLMLLGCAASLAYPGLWENGQLLAAILLLAGGSAAGLLGIGLMLHPAVVNSRIVAWFQGLPKVGGVVRELVRGVSLYQRRPRVLLNVLLMSVVIHIGNCAAYFGCALGLNLGGVAPSFGVHLVIIPVAEIAAAVLPLPGGIGAREGALQYLYGAFSAVPGVAEGGFFTALGYSVVSAVVAVLGGAFACLCRRECAEEAIEMSAAA